MNNETIQLPDPIPYPKIYNLNEVKELSGKYCYILKRYPEKGYGLTIYRTGGTVCVRISDFTGKLLDPTEEERYKPVMDYSRQLIVTMKLIGINQALFYFSDYGKSYKLVDMRLSLNKFCGPGYLADFFGRQKIPVQECAMESAVIDSDKVKSLLESKEEYILKPAAFKSMIRDDMVYPLYGVVNHETKPLA